MAESICTYADLCSGCPWISKSYDHQIDAKTENFRRLWADIDLPSEPIAFFKFRTIKPFGIRDRADLSLKYADGSLKLGFFRQGSRDILDIHHCPQMSASLSSWHQEFRRDLPQLSQGSVRLRVAPDGRRGVWLDFSNQDIKKLLDEKSWLLRLNQMASLEIGQKRKRLITKADGSLGLGDPKLEIWSHTFVKGKAIPLYLTIGGFTQVGAEANQILVESFESLLSDKSGETWIELGSGAGNLTIPLAGQGAKVIALEIDPLAVEGLEHSAKEAGLSHLITPLRYSFLKKSPELMNLLASADGLLVDPPRSGLEGFVQIMAEVPPNLRPRQFIYMSCSGESLLKDLKQLVNLGYEITSVEGIDQFPQSPHGEYLVKLCRI